MQELSYTTMDRAGWKAGPWDCEPDKVQFTDEATGLPCLIVRGPVGALCEYVGVSEGHPAFKKDYGDIDVDVHGGLTFADECQPGFEDKVICHKPAPGEPDNVWWLGFDCAHCDDLAPGYHPILGDEYSSLFNGVYRDINYVRTECASLAAQLAAM